MERAFDLLALLDGKDVVEVEDRLLPVCVLSMRTGRETDRLVAGSELDVEPCDYGVDEVVAASDKIEGAAEGEIGGCALVKVEGENARGVCYDGLDLDGVDEGL